MQNIMRQLRNKQSITPATSVPICTHNIRYTAAEIKSARRVLKVVASRSRVASIRVERKVVVI